MIKFILNFFRNRSFPGIIPESIRNKQIIQEIAKDSKLSSKISFRKKNFYEWLDAVSVFALGSESNLDEKKAFLDLIIVSGLYPIYFCQEPFIILLNDVKNKSITYHKYKNDDSIPSLHLNRHSLVLGGTAYELFFELGATRQSVTVYGAAKAGSNTYNYYTYFLDDYFNYLNENDEFYKDSFKYFNYIYPETVNYSSVINQIFTKSIEKRFYPDELKLYIESFLDPSCKRNKFDSSGLRGINVSILKMSFIKIVLDDPNGNEYQKIIIENIHDIFGVISEFVISSGNLDLLNLIIKYRPEYFADNIKEIAKTKESTVYTSNNVVWAFGNEILFHILKKKSSSFTALSLLIMNLLFEKNFLYFENIKASIVSVMTGDLDEYDKREILNWFQARYPNDISSHIETNSSLYLQKDFKLLEYVSNVIVSNEKNEDIIFSLIRNNQKKYKKLYYDMINDGFRPKDQIKFILIDFLMINNDYNLDVIFEFVSGKIESELLMELNIRQISKIKELFSLLSFKCRLDLCKSFLKTKLVRLNQIDHLYTSFLEINSYFFTLIEELKYIKSISDYSTAIIKIKGLQESRLIRLMTPDWLSNLNNQEFDDWVLSVPLDSMELIGFGEYFANCLKHKASDYVSKINNQNTYVIALKNKINKDNDICCSFSVKKSPGGIRRIKLEEFKLKSNVSVQFDLILKHKLLNLLNSSYFE